MGFLIIDITLVMEGDKLAVRKPANTDIETNRLNCSGTKLLALSLFVFIIRRGGGTCANLDDFGNEKARLWWRGQCFD
jgi:hypothetical protein